MRDRKDFLKLALATGAAATLPAPAFAEGDTAPAILAPVPFAKQPLDLAVGFKTAIRGYEHAYPTLAEALKQAKPAHSPRIEWTSRDGRHEHNYTQIIRFPYGVTGTQLHSREHGERLLRNLRLEQLHRHLGAVEHTLLHGRRGVHGNAWLCGGVSEFGPGVLSLRLLRDLHLLTRFTADRDCYEEEWLSEFSLQVS